MSKLSINYRSLMTDTLPYEVPVIFSNDILHSSLSSPPTDETAAMALNLARQKMEDYSLPLSYQIAKGDQRTATLGIIHPTWQIKISHFYEDHFSSLLNHCAYDAFTLRRPTGLALPFAEKVDESEDARLRLGVAQEAKDSGEPNITHMISYFVYGKYNLMGKFIDSREHTRLERRFKFERTLDISKCFYNIYTHSIAWAVKDKESSKQNSYKFSFEGELDTLMQKCNYNETNGIIVGPEFSRIFAEIILQRVDWLVRSELSYLEVTKNYDIRRYVDDYFVYANDEHTLEVIENCICRHLEKFKLFLNDAKRETSTRPFVSTISMARQELSSILSNVRAAAIDLTEPDYAERNAAKLRLIRDSVSEVRLIVKKYDIGFENLSGWIFSRFGRTVRAILARADKMTDVPARQQGLEVCILLLQSAFYICALDLRVRPTYSLFQLCQSVFSNIDKFGPEQRDEILHVIDDEIGGLIRTMLARGQIAATHTDEIPGSIEAYNLMICGAYFVGEDFLKGSQFRQAVRTMLSTHNVSYFAFITLKFCMLRASEEFEDELKLLNEIVLRQIRSENFKPRIKSEHHLMACDFVSSPDISDSMRRTAFIAAFGGKASKATIALLKAHIGFVDWQGASVEHLLARKSLRPVYAWD